MGIRFNHVLLHQFQKGLIFFCSHYVSVKDHNRTVENPEDQINTVLCPGLGTAVGRMPTRRAAFQMRQAFEICALGKESPLTNPDCLSAVYNHHEAMLCY